MSLQQKNQFLDLPKLLAPISRENPSGEYLFYEGTYDQIQEARREDDAGLDQGVWTTDLKKADWGRVQDLCMDALLKRSKDIQLAAWLMEAWLHLEGFFGLRKGLEVLCNVTMEFWEDIHPLAEGDDVEVRTAPFFWINDKLSVRLKLSPIIEKGSQDLKGLSFSDWQKASKNENLIRKGQLDPADEAANVFTQSKFLTECALSSNNYYSELSNDISESIEWAQKLEAFLDEKCGRDSPSLIGFRETLEIILRLIDETIKPRLGISREEGPEKQAKPQEKKMEKKIVAVPAPEAVSTVQNRAEAYRMLQQAADYLLVTEPHSPAPYLVKRAVSWGNMSLAELLSEIVKDESDMRTIFELLGMKPVMDDSMNDHDDY
jgi:type VI secretion system ImpA family protein